MKNICSEKNTKLPPGGSWAELYEILSYLLTRRNVLLPMVKEFNLIDNALKQYFTGVKECSIANFKVKGRYEDIITYNFPSALKKKYMAKTKQWVVDIEKLK